MNLDAPLRELFGDDPRGADLLESDLGMGVQIPSNGGEFVGKAFDAVDMWAFWLSDGGRVGTRVD